MDAQQPGLFTEQARTSICEDMLYQTLLIALFEQGELDAGALRHQVRENMKMLTTVATVVNNLQVLRTWGLLESAYPDTCSKHDLHTWSLTRTGTHIARQFGENQTLHAPYIYMLHNSTSLQALLMVLGETALSAPEIEQGLQGLSYFGLHTERLAVRLYILQHLGLAQLEDSGVWNLSNKGLEAVPLVYTLDAG